MGPVILNGATTGEWVYEDGLLDKYGTPRVRRDEDGKVIGFSVAVGASGERGVPYLSGPIDLANFTTDKRYAKALERARERWEHFAAFCAVEGVAFPEPILWLVELEVA